MGAHTWTSVTSTRRAAEMLFTLSAVGEIGVGLLVAILPGVIGFLLGAPLDAAGAVAARMMGIAAAGLGLAWWPDRNRLDPSRLREVAPAFIGYNVGVGLVFAAWSWTAGQALSLSSLVAVTHLALGSAFAITTALSRTTAPRQR